MLVEGGEFGPKAHDSLQLLHQNAVQVGDVVFDVRLWLFDVLKRCHVFLNDVNDVIDMLSMVRNQCLFLFQDDFYEILVLSTDPVNILCVLIFNTVVAL